MTVVIALFAEAQSDAAIAALLLDRAVAEDERTASWVSDAMDTAAAPDAEVAQATLAAVRQFVDADGALGCEAAKSYIDLHHTAEALAELRSTYRAPQSRGKFDGQPGKADARAVRSAADVVRLLNVGQAGVGLLVYMRDIDGQPERHEGHEQARKESTARGDAFAIVFATPIPCREAWACACVDPTQVDRTVLARDLGFDPVADSHRLHHGHTGWRSAEEALRALGVADFDAEVALMRQTPLPDMRLRGSANGLAAYLMELSDRVVPLFAASAPAE